MFSQVSGATTLGINGHVITVEVDISRGVTGFNIVGLATGSCSDSEFRVPVSTGKGNSEPGTG